MLVRDSGTWTAFASTRGRFAPLAVSPTAVLVNPPTHNNDAVLLVRDGTSLHAFSGFVGHWVTRAISPTAQVDSQRNVALLADGGVLSAFDAYSGQWYDHPGAEAIVQLSCDGTCGIAIGTTTVYGFSALHASWAAAPLPASATLVRDDDWAVLHDGVQGLGFSGLTGTFATAVTGPIQSTRTEDLLGMFTVVGGLHAYSAIRGTWSQTAISSLASVRTNVACGVVVDGPTAIAYSAPLAQFVPLAVDSGSEALAGVVVAITDQVTLQPFLFSALTGTWQAAPADVLPLLPRVTTTVALLSTSYGWRAFSARDASFTALVAPGSTAETNESSAPAVVWDASDIWFTFTAPAQGTYFIDTNGTPSVDTVLKVFRSCADLANNRIACDDDADCAAIYDCVYNGTDGGVGPCLDLTPEGAACEYQCIALYPAGKDKYHGEGHEFGLLDNSNKSVNVGLNVNPSQTVSFGAEAASPSRNMPR